MGALSCGLAAFENETMRAAGHADEVLESPPPFMAARNG